MRQLVFAARNAAALILITCLSGWACNTTYDVETVVLADTQGAIDTRDDVDMQGADSTMADADVLDTDGTAADADTHRADADADLVDIDGHATDADTQLSDLDATPPTCDPVCTGQTCCETGAASVCVDTTQDSAHCGGCGVACQGSEACVASVCVCTQDTDCLVNQLCCSGACVAQDETNCGICSNTCGAGELCDLLTGGCVTCVEAGLTDCAGTCVDLTSNVDHCAGCGQACPNSAECLAGVCDCGDGVHCSQARGDRCNSNACRCGNGGAPCDTATTSACVSGVCRCGTAAACASGMTCDDALGTCI